VPTAGYNQQVSPAGSVESRRDAARPRDLIFSFFGIFRQHVGGWISIAHLVQVMARMDVDGPSVRSAVSRLKRRGLLEARTISGAAGYGLSEDAQRVLVEGDERIFGRRPADASGGWVMVVFSVPEEERDKRHIIRSRLAGLGFGTATPGVWLAPAHHEGEVRRALTRLGLAEYVDLFIAQDVGFGDTRAKVAQWWDLPAIEDIYSDFSMAQGPVLRKWTRRRDLDDVEAFRDYLLLMDAWRRVVYLDPRLPNELLPARWAGLPAERIFMGLHARLEEPAHKFVLSILESA
jgi:phenylacetic acid degradation operon negative regulatory protein